MLPFQDTAAAATPVETAPRRSPAPPTPTPRRRGQAEGGVGNGEVASPAAPAPTSGEVTGWLDKRGAGGLFGSNAWRRR